MGDIATDVTGPLNAVATVMQGSAAKESQMKDGPPESQEEKPAGETQTPYDKYKDDVKKAWDNYRRHGDAGQLGLDVAQAIADLGARSAPGLVDVFGKLAGVLGD